MSMFDGLSKLLKTAVRSAARADGVCNICNSFHAPPPGGNTGPTRDLGLPEPGANGAKSYIRECKVPEPASGGTSRASKAPASIASDDGVDEHKQQTPAESEAEAVSREVEKEARDIVMDSMISGLINKALISALFLNFNIPSIMNPPMPVDTTNSTFLIFFLSASFAIASGFYCILSATFIATHAKAATVTQAMAITFSTSVVPHALMNHQVFLAQGLLTSVQVASVCVSYMDNNWALWLGIGACVASLVCVSITKIAVNSAWQKTVNAE